MSKRVNSCKISFINYYYREINIAQLIVKLTFYCDDLDTFVDICLGLSKYFCPLSNLDKNWIKKSYEIVKYVHDMSIIGHKNTYYHKDWGVINVSIAIHTAVIQCR